METTYKQASQLLKLLYQDEEVCDIPDFLPPLLVDSGCPLTDVTAEGAKEYLKKWSGGTTCMFELPALYQKRFTLIAAITSDSKIFSTILDRLEECMKEYSEKCHAEGGHMAPIVAKTDDTIVDLLKLYIYGRIGLPTKIASGDDWEDGMIINWGDWTLPGSCIREWMLEEFTVSPWAIPLIAAGQEMFFRTPCKNIFYGARRYVESCMVNVQPHNVYNCLQYWLKVLKNEDLKLTLHRQIISQYQQYLPDPHTIPENMILIKTLTYLISESSTNTPLMRRSCDTGRECYTFSILSGDIFTYRGNDGECPTIMEELLELVLKSTIGWFSHNGRKIVIGVAPVNILAPEYTDDIIPYSPKDKVPDSIREYIQRQEYYKNKDYRDCCMLLCCVVSVDCKRLDHVKATDKDVVYNTENIIYFLANRYSTYHHMPNTRIGINIEDHSAYGYKYVEMMELDLNYFVEILYMVLCEILVVDRNTIDAPPIVINMAMLELFFMINSVRDSFPDDSESDNFKVLSIDKLNDAILRKLSPMTDEYKDVKSEKSGLLSIAKESTTQMSADDVMRNYKAMMIMALNGYNSIYNNQEDIVLWTCMKDMISKCNVSEDELLYEFVSSNLISNRTKIKDNEKYNRWVKRYIMQIITTPYPEMPSAVFNLAIHQLYVVLNHFCRITTEYRIDNFVDLITSISNYTHSRDYVPIPMKYFFKREDEK